MSDSIVSLWNKLLKQQTFSSLGVSGEDLLRTIIFFSLKKGKFTMNDIRIAAATIDDTNSEPFFLWSLMYREGVPIPPRISLSGIETDSTLTELQTESDLIKAIQYHAQGILSRKTFSSKDIHAIGQAISCAEVTTLIHLLSFTNSKVNIPPLFNNLSSILADFPEVEEEYNKVKVIVTLHNERQDNRIINKNRLYSIKTSYGTFI